MRFFKIVFLMTTCLFVSVKLMTATLQASELTKRLSNPSNVLEGVKLVNALQAGGYVIYLRHGKTDLSTHDTDHNNLANCKTQRRLSTEGRKQARYIGKVIQELDIKIDKVISSPYCRAVNSAKLAFGKVTIDNALKYTLIADEDTTMKQSLALKALLSKAPKPGTNTVLCGHNGNLKEATGIWPHSEGMAVIFKPDNKGHFNFIATVPANNWVKLLRGKKSP